MAQNSKDIDTGESMRPCHLSLKDLQHCLLPVDPPCLHGFDVDWHCGHTCLLKGLFLDFPSCFQSLTERPERLTVALGDVAGHRSCTALVTSTLRAYLRATIAQMADPGAVISAVNRLLTNDRRIPNQGVSLLMMDIDRTKGRLSWASAGRMSALIIRDNASQIEVLNNSGTPMGLNGKAQYQAASIFGIQCGDTVIAASEDIWESLESIGDASVADQLCFLSKEANDAHALKLSVFNVLKPHYLRNASIDDALFLAIRISDDQKGLRNWSSCRKENGRIVEDFGCSIRYS